MNTPRILILRMSALGDILHALPLLGALRAHWPQAHLGWLVEPGGAPLLQGHPMLDALHVFPKKEWRQDKWRTWRELLPQLTAELRAQNYEVAIDVQGLTKSAVWGWRAGAPRRIGFAPPDGRELAPWLATERVQPRARERHIVERNMALLRPLGIEAAGVIRTPVHLPHAARERADEIVGTDAPLAVMALGAGWPTKIWDAERFGELARRLVREHGARVALAWGPGEEPLVARACAAAGVPPPNFSVTTLPADPGVYVLPRTTFVVLGAIIERSSLFVGGDTGPTHFAAAMEVPTVSMMGPLDARRNGPYGAHCRTIQHAIPRRAPWWINHRKWCDPATSLELVSVDEVFDACCAALAGPVKALPQ